MGNKMDLAHETDIIIAILILIIAIIIVSVYVMFYDD